MRLSSLIIAISGIAVAGGSVYAAREVLNMEQPKTVTEVEQAVVDVIVANRDILLGQTIEPQLLTTISWPAKSVPDGVFTDISLLIPAQGGEPRRARRPISKGELLLMNKISDFGEKVTIVQTLTEGHRAMAVEVNAETGVGGFVTPGDFVDVVLTHGVNETLRAVTILQNIRIVGVDQDSDEQSDSPEIARTVTLEVTPEESQRLALSQQAGTLSLTLRSEPVEVDTPLASIRLKDLLQEESPTPEGVSSPTIAVRRANIIVESN